VNYILENIKSRRSVRSYLDQEVPKKLIEKILEAARFAPSALNKQPWEFVVVTDRELIKKISSSIRDLIKKVFLMLPILKLFVKKLKDDKSIAAIRKTATSTQDTVFYNAPVVIFIVSKHSSQWVKTDCSLAAQNMMLAAHSLGLGSCFVGRGLYLSKDKKLSMKIGLKKGYKIYAALTFGYPKEFSKNIPARKKDNLLCWKG